MSHLVHGRLCRYPAEFWPLPGTKIPCRHKKIPTWKVIQAGQFEKVKGLSFIGTVV
jgi:hypothetical protein